ncbi:hypothetical protein GALL_433740 [mine drainage metagenome]|uniref:Uncharacterized protein n=1 Tax=mine drainage metagenome TaxID=410659 RepID=A0A1J5QG72_9ZZZZ
MRQALKPGVDLFLTRCGHFGAALPGREISILDLQRTERRIGFALRES